MPGRSRICRIRYSKCVPVINRRHRPCPGGRFGLAPPKDPNRLVCPGSRLSTSAPTAPVMIGLSSGIRLVPRGGRKSTLVSAVSSLTRTSVSPHVRSKLPFRTAPGSSSGFCSSPLRAQNHALSPYEVISFSLFAPIHMKS